MRMTRDEIKAYLLDWERGTLNTIETWAERVSTYACFYGRNTPRGPVGACDPQKVETWSPSGYGSTAAILDMAIRHDREKVLAWVARNVRLAMDLVPWWVDTFGKPPGENTRIPGQCGDTKESIVALGQHADDDVLRHWNSYGLLTASIHPRLIALGLWNSIDARRFAATLFQWVQAQKAHIIEHPREYIRYGNSLDGLCGMVEVFRACGATGLEAEAYETLKTFFRYVFAPQNAVYVANASGDIWKDYNYGHMVVRGDACYEPFNYGWYPFGMQAWYRGHLLVAMIHAAKLAAERADVTFIRQIIAVADAYTRWMDPTRRTDAPLAPLDEIGVRWFHNSILQGGFVDPTEKRLLSGHDDTTLEAWESVDESAPFCRYAWHDTGVGGWKSDGGYWETNYVDPLGVSHQRKHNSGGARLYEPGIPGLETANGYECVDGLFARALIFNDKTLGNFARIVLFQHIAFANRSDTVVRLDERLRSGIVEGANLVGKPARAFHWAVQCGWIFRSADLGGGSLAGFGAPDTEQETDE
jgi:hypothetical protein